MATGSTGQGNTETQSVPSGHDGNPGTLSGAATVMQQRRQLMRACYGGTETMRNQTTLLPQYERESATRYQARLASTFALNKLRDAVDSASAKPFKTLLTLNNNTDPDLDLWVQDVDLMGTHLHIFAHQLFNNALVDGQCHFLVDHPDTSAMPSLGAQKASGARPYMKLVKDEQLVAAYTDYVGGDRQVTHCRIKGSRIQRTADFREIVWNQIWVIEKDPSSPQGVVQLWESRGSPPAFGQVDAGAGGGGWSLISETPLTLAEVPLVSLFAGDMEGDYLTKPLFQDLAYKQVEHWISTSDQRSILSAARFPMLACSGVQIDPEDENSFAIGPYKVLYAPEANGRWYFVEPKGTAIESGRKDLEALELQMDMLALNPVPGTHRQYVPQNERDIQESRVYSVVHDLAIQCKDALERGVNFMGLWANKDLSQVSVKLNTEFSQTKDKITEVAHLIKLWETRGLSRGALLSELRNRDILGDDFDAQTELQLWQAVDALSEDGTLLPGKWQLTAPTAPTGTPPAGTPPAGTQPKPAPTPAAPANPKDVPGWPAGQNRPTPQH